MYTAKTLRNRFLIISSIFLLTVSCKNKRTFNNENGQSVEDIRRFQEQNDAVIQDINIGIMEQPLLRGGSSTQPFVSVYNTKLCGASVDSVSVYSGILRIRYNGTSCNKFTKSGEIVASILNYPEVKWKNKGCVLKVEFKAYKAIGSNGKSVQIDGTEYITNVSGDTWYEMQYLNTPQLVQTQLGHGLKITLTGNNTALFNTNRKVTFSYTGQNTGCVIEGLGVFEEKVNLDNWGQNTEGVNFTAEIITPIVWNSACSSNLPLKGELRVRENGKNFDMNCRYGVDKNGNRIPDEKTCPFGWEFSWSYKKKVNTRVFPYN